MERQYPVLVETRTNKVTEFGECDQFTIGRSHACSLDITSPFISRQQCIFKKTVGDLWTLYDQSTFKSTLVNGNPLKDGFQILKDSDIITFCHYKDGEFIFYTSPANIPTKKRKVETEPDESIYILEGDAFNTSCVLSSPVKTQDSNTYKTQALKEVSSQKENQSPSTSPNLCSESPLNSKPTLTVFETENKSLKELLKSKENETDILKRELEELKERLFESEIEQQRLIRELQENSKKTENKQDVVFDDNIKKEVMDDVFLMDEDVEEPVWPDIDFKPFEIETNVPNIDGIEENIDDRCDNNDDDSDGEMDSYSDEVCNVSDNLSAIINTIDMIYYEQGIKSLKEQVEMNAEEIIKQKNEKDSFQSKVIETLEHELHCGVCSDLLYKPVTLNCMHTFCTVCVAEWKKKKKECPICRTKIKTEVTPLVIDSIIDKAAELLEGEFKARREEQKTERARAAAKPPPSRKKGRQSARGSRRQRISDDVITISSSDIGLPIETIEIRESSTPHITGVIDLTSPRYQRTTTI